MSVSQANAPRPLPKPFIVIGSIFAVGHLLAIGMLALAAESGPWPTNFGIGSKSPGPKFATAISSHIAGPYYLKPLAMTNDYHFKSNKAAQFAAYFEVILKNDRDEVIKTLSIPDPKANFWVRHRQSILAQGLAEDQPLQKQATERIAPANREMSKVDFWDLVDGTLRLKSVDANSVPNDRMKPSEWSRLLAQSYMRHLCKEHNAASAELVRHSREVPTPMDMFLPPRPEAYKELSSYFGVYRREE